ncbi:hypothetical protein CDL12_04895 [Handroanthus impetiginosus]|uniref:Retrotransposon gag domain-containing protein n=1 Tax=Handroanthus impetiginosus TaxID=429701 RepID=A0A2G9HY02_9LAMI|nr:hypothetical protein CDL12_04895 [Handroanthus impetiginosus]
MLGESTQTWFNQLSSGLIHSFAQLRELFLHQYASSKHLRKTSFSLFSIQQEERQTLREYIRRFTETTLEISTAHKEVLANTFVKRLRDGPFFFSLVKKPVDDFDELLARAKKYVNLEEAKKIKRAELNNKRKDKKDKGSCLDNFILLKIPRSQVLMEIESSNIIKRPFRVSQGPTQSKSDTFCKFHNEYGHDTDECMHLRNEIERLIQKGMLKEFVAKDDESALNTVGAADRSPIIQFGPKDLAGLHSPHQDALVISANIANYDVARVFIDCGNSVDILFLKAFEQIDLRPIRMEEVQISLVGFSGESVHPIGQIALPLSLGHGADVKTRMVRFLVTPSWADQC